jgi:CheY-like chemotaxis protein
MANILLIDGDKNNIDFMQSVLSKVYDLYTFSNWSNAFACVMQIQFDLIIIALEITAANGKEIARICRNSSNAKILLFSSKPAHELKVHARSYQADGFIQKTADPKQTHANVTQALLDAGLRARPRRQTSRHSQSTIAVIDSDGGEPAPRALLPKSPAEMIEVQDPNALRFRDIIDRFPTADNEEFCTKFPFHCLVQLNYLDNTEADGFFTSPDIVKTEKIAPDLSDGIVFPLEKNGSNGFSHMITVGRSANNDVAINSRLVSKFHAYFTWRDEAWFLRDSGSTNGSFVNKARLDPELYYKVAADDIVAFSKSIVLKFVDPQTLFMQLKFFRRLSDG